MSDDDTIPGVTDLEELGFESPVDMLVNNVDDPSLDGVIEVLMSVPPDSSSADQQPLSRPPAPAE